MEPHNFIIVAGTLEFAGIVVSLLMLSKVLRISRILSDKSMRLLAIGLLFYIIGLSFEMIGSFFAWGAVYSHRPRRIEELSVIMLNRGTFLGMPFYTVSYALMAASLYTGHVNIDSRGGRVFGMVPFIAYVFADYNLINLAVLIVAAYYSVARYGTARIGNTLFYGIAGASHLLGVLITLHPHWILIAGSMMLRGVAPIALFIASRLGGSS